MTIEEFTASLNDDQLLFLIAVFQNCSSAAEITIFIEELIGCLEVLVDVRGLEY